MNTKQKIQYAAERVVVWTLRRVLVNYSAIVAREIARLDTNSRSLQTAVQFVSADHWKHLNDLNARLWKLEGDQIPDRWSTERYKQWEADEQAADNRWKYLNDLNARLSKLEKAVL